MIKMAFVKSLMSKSLLVGVGVGTCAVLTKPTNESFLPQMTMYNLDPYEKVIIVGTMGMFTTINDYGVFKIATINYDGKKCRCIGAFNKWTELNE